MIIPDRIFASITIRCSGYLVLEARIVATLIVAYDRMLLNLHSSGCPIDIFFIVCNVRLPIELWRLQDQHVVVALGRERGGKAWLLGALALCCGEPTSINYLYQALELEALSLSLLSLTWILPNVSPQIPWLHRHRNTHSLTQLVIVAAFLHQLQRSVQYSPFLFFLVPTGGRTFWDTSKHMCALLCLSRGFSIFAASISYLRLCLRSLDVMMVATNCPCCLRAWTAWDGVFNRRAISRARLFLTCCPWQRQSIYCNIDW